MIVLQKNRGTGSFLEISDVEIPRNFESQMLMVNSFRFIAKSVFGEVDNRQLMSVRIDGLTLLNERFSRLRPARRELEQLLRDLCSAIREIKEYMLNADGLVLDLRFILYSEKEGHHVFLYIPGRRIPFSAQLKSMMDELLKIYNHQDRKDVEYMYDMYSNFIVDNFTPEYYCRLFDEKKSRREAQPHAMSEFGFREFPGGTQMKVAEGRKKVRGYDEGAERKIEKNLNEDLEENTGGKEGPDFSLYVLIMIASIIVSLVLFLIFGVGSIKISILINLAGIAFIAMCELRRKREEEDEAMAIYAATNEENKRNKKYKEEIDRNAKYKAEIFRDEKNEKYRDESLENEKYKKEIVSSEFEKNTSDKQIERIGNEDEYIETSVLSDSTEGVSKLISKGKRLAEDISIPEGRLRIGRLGSVCEYCIDEPEISRVHAVLEKKGNTVTLTDMDSTNGTYVNDIRIQSAEAVELSQGDIISMADIKYECL